MKTTFFAKKADVVKKWVVIDAADKPLEDVVIESVEISEN